MIEGLSGCFYSKIDIFIGGFTYVCEKCLIGWIDHVKAFSFDTICELSVDEELL
jgi:hypothetical protein